MLLFIETTEKKEKEPPTELGDIPGLNPLRRRAMNYAEKFLTALHPTVKAIIVNYGCQKEGIKI